MSQQQPPQGPPQGYGPPPGGYGPPPGPGGYGPPQGYVQGQYPGYPPQPPAKPPWYHSSIIMGLSLFLCWPIGLLLLWTSKNTSMVTKVLGTAVFGGIGLLVMAGMSSSKSRSTTPTYVPAANAPVAQAAQARPAPTPEPEKTVQAMQVDIKTLLSEYKTNEVRADANYKDKDIIFTGKVGEVKKDILGKVYVTIGTGQLFEIPEVQCFVDDNSVGKAAGLSKGDKVTAVGHVDGLMMNVLVKECRFQ